MRGLVKLAFSILLAMPAPAMAANGSLGAVRLVWEYKGDVLPDDLILTIDNRSDSAACVPKIDVEDYHNVTLRQSGAEIPRWRSTIEPYSSGAAWI